MFDRRLIGDFALAFLLAAPTVALSRPQPSEAELTGATSPLVEKAAYAERTSVEKRAADLPAE